MNKFKCSMNKKKESLFKKSEATTEDISVKLTELKDVTDAGKVLDDLKKLGFTTIDYGDYASKDKAYAVLKHPNGMYAELDYTWVQDSSGRDSYSPGEVVAYDYFKDKDEYEEIHGYSPNESKKPEACKGGKDDDKKDGKDGKAAESKKSEGVGDTIKMGIDYTMFMRMLDTAAYLDADDDYKEALWDYFSEMGEIEDALVFFDNLFQYTDWKTAEEIWDDYSNILGEKPEGQDAEEALDAYLEENDLGGESAYKHGDHYLIVR